MSSKRGSGFILGIIFSTAVVFIVNALKQRRHDETPDSASDQQDSFSSYFSNTALEPLIEQGRSFISFAKDVIREAVQEGQNAAAISQDDMEESLQQAHGTKSSPPEDDQE
jgi:hypothetical protein